MTEQQKQQLKQSHPTGFLGVFYVYDWKRLRRSLPFLCALLATLVLAAVLLFDRKKEFFTDVQALAELGLSVFPSILGFTIGAYALVIGFASSANLKKFTRKKEGKKGSFYQALMSIFSVSILLQTVCITLCYFVGYVIKSKLSVRIFPDGADFYPVVNYFITLLIGFLSLWSLFTIPFVATNLFNFAQTNHLLGTKERIADEEAASEGEGENAAGQLREG